MKSNIDEIRKILKSLSHGHKVPKIIYDTIFEACVREIEQKHRPVLFKRDPNISRDRLSACLCKIITGETVTMSPIAVKGYGADFDGSLQFCHR